MWEALGARRFSFKHFHWKNHVGARRQKTHQRCYDFFIIKLVPDGVFTSNTSFWSLSGTVFFFFFLQPKYNWNSFIPVFTGREKKSTPTSRSVLSVNDFICSPRKCAQGYSSKCTCEIIVIHSFSSSVLFCIPLITPYGICNLIQYAE